MKRILVLGNLALASMHVFATGTECIATNKPHCPPPPPPIEMVVTDTWDGKDKRDHLVGSLVLGSLARGFVTTDKWLAGGICMVPGLAKELYDARKGAAGAFSEKDMVANAVGCGIGVLGTDFALTKEGKAYTLWLNLKF
jgi:uncharacterized protein YfiM (DUF2279 family)